MGICSFDARSRLGPSIQCILAFLHTCACIQCILAVGCEGVWSKLRPGALDRWIGLDRRVKNFNFQGSEAQIGNAFNSKGLGIDFLVQKDSVFRAPKK